MTYGSVLFLCLVLLLCSHDFIGFRLEYAKADPVVVERVFGASVSGEGSARFLGGEKMTVLVPAGQFEIQSQALVPELVLTPSSALASLKLCARLNVF